MRQRREAHGTLGINPPIPPGSSPRQLRGRGTPPGQPDHDAQDRPQAGAQDRKVLALFPRPAHAAPGRKPRRNQYGLRQDTAGIWRCNFSVSGRRIRLSCGTAVRKAAEEWCAALATQTWRQARLGDAPAITWEQASAEWFREKEKNRKRDIGNDNLKWAILNPYFKERMLAEIDTESCNDALDELAEARDWSNASYNRHRSFLTALFNFARKKWPKLPAAPVITRRTEHPPEPRPLDRDEEARLFEASPPLHLLRPARFTLACGARESNVTGLRWWKHRFAADGTPYPHVGADLKTMHVPAAHAKAGKTLAIPLNATAQAILAEARDCPKCGHEELVFTDHGYPILKVSNTAWYNWLARAKIKGFKWHGLRTTWTTRHVEAGTPIDVLMRLGGWSSADTLRKHYVKLAPDVIARYVENGGAA